jgi:hypothetical protein
VCLLLCPLRTPLTGPNMRVAFTMRASAVQLALVLVALPSAASAAVKSRRILLVDTCEGDCQAACDVRQNNCAAARKIAVTRMRWTPEQQELYPCPVILHWSSEDPVQIHDECNATCKLPCESAKFSACEGTCEKQRTETIDKCKANIGRDSAMYGPAVTATAVYDCEGQADSKRDRCKQVCQRACKPTETPTGTKPPTDMASTDTKPTENPAGAGSADTKPPASPTDSADAKPPVETGSAQPKNTAEAGSHDTDTGEGAHAGHR